MIWVTWILQRELILYQGFGRHGRASTQSRFELVMIRMKFGASGLDQRQEMLHPIPLFSKEDCRGQMGRDSGPIHLGYHRRRTSSPPKISRKSTASQITHLHNSAATEPCASAFLKFECLKLDVLIILHREHPQARVQI